MKKKGEIYIDISKLPKKLRRNLLKSQEVDQIPETHLVKLNQVFANVLASKNIFRRTGTLEGIIMNQIMLEKLQQDSSPILKEDLQMYLACDFYDAEIRGDGT